MTETKPRRALALTSVLVRDYDEALAFYVDVLGFCVIEDSVVPAQNKRWVVVAPPGATESGLLLARVTNAEQESRVGNQTGGRVFLFMHTDDFWRDFNLYTARGVTFVRPPSEEPYGTVAVFRDLYGNLWDLVQPKRTDCNRLEHLMALPWLRTAVGVFGRSVWTSYK